MTSRLTYQQKNYLLIAASVILLILSWNLAFEKTFDALSLHQQLSGRISTADISVNPVYLRKKERVLNTLVEGFSVDTAEWENEFWMKASRLAVFEKVNVSYNPSQIRLSQDSSLFVKRQYINFEGGYTSLVRLIDTLEKTGKIGYLSSLSFEVDRKARSDEEQRLYLKTVFSVVKK